MHLTQKVPVIARSEATWQSSIYIPKCIFTALVCKNKKKRGKPVYARFFSQDCFDFRLAMKDELLMTYSSPSPDFALAKSNPRDNLPHSPN